MLNSIDEILAKKIFTVKDLAFVIGKKTQTIRKWEKKGIIPKCKNYGSNGWREYDCEEFANILETILDYPWKRDIIYNPGQLQLIINYLRRNINND